MNNNNQTSITSEIEDKILVYARAVSGLYERMLDYASVKADFDPSDYKQMRRLVNLVYGTDDIGVDVEKRLKDGSKRENILIDLEDEFKEKSIGYRDLYSKALVSYFENELEPDFVGNAFQDPLDQAVFKLMMEHIGPRVFAQILTKALDGDPVYQLLLGKCYFLGWGTEVDKEKGYNWIKKAAETDDSEALYYAGLAEEMLTNDQTGIRLNPESAELYKKSFYKGNPEAAFALYRYYKNYSDENWSKKESEKWFQKGLDSGSVYCNYLKEIKPENNWAPNNVLNLFDWVCAAASFLEPDALVFLSKLYGKGHAGLEVDPKKERECLAIARQIS